MNHDDRDAHDVHGSDAATHRAETQSPWGDDAGGVGDEVENDPLAGLAQAVSAAAPQQSRPVAMRGPKLDATGQIDADLHCKGCGYNLRGQRLENTCPECGASVAWSSRGDRLSYYDPRWLGSLSQGALWLINSVVASIVLGVLDGIVSVILTRQQFASASPQTGPLIMAPAPGMLQQAVSLTITILSLGIYLFAVWQLTAPEPSRRNVAALSARLLFRWGSVAHAGLLVLASAVMFLDMDAGSVVGLVGWIPFAIAFFAMFVYLRRLALRVPDKSLAGHTRLVMWGMAVTIGLYIVTIMLAVAFAAMMFSTMGPAGSGSGPRGGGVLGIVVMGAAALSLISGLVFGIWWFVLLFLYRGHFRKAQQLALASA